MTTTIELASDGSTVSVELDDGNLSRKILEELPLESRISTWGDEFYFPIPVESEPDSVTQDVTVGDVAFWHEGQSLAVFFGPTPMSDGEEPVPADDVEIVGTVSSGLDRLDQFKAGQSISVTPA